VARFHRGGRAIKFAEQDIKSVRVRPN